jgi:prolipoprotein diacylglyceryltransferase
VEFTLLWAVLTAVASSWTGLRIWSERLPKHAFDRLMGAGLVALVVGRLVAMLAQGVSPLASPGDFIVIRGGVHTGAASAAFLVSLLWSTRKEPGALDALAPATLLGLAGWHAGCLWRGACLGAPSDLPWAWALDGGTVTRHPVEIYAAVGLAVGAWLVSLLGWRLWMRAGAGLALAAGIRLVTEPLRPSITGGPIWWYVAGIALGALVIAAGPSVERSEARTPT